MSALKICVTVFSGTIKARILKLDIHMKNELLYRGIENWDHCFHSSLNLSIFLSFSGHSFFPGIVHVTVFKYGLYMENE